MQKNIVGIIPIHNHKKSYSLLEQSLLNIGNNYLAIERSVYECAKVGCTTIWIACPVKTSLFLREYIGDYTYDLSSSDEKSLRRKIPIFYINTYNEYYKNDNCPIFSIINTAKIAIKTHSQITQWLTPDIFYVSFPQSIYDISSLTKKEINSNNSFSISFQNKSIYNNLYLGFTFKAFELDDIEKLYFAEKTKIWLKDNSSYVNLNSVFEKAIDIQYHNINWCYDISSWEGYRDFLRSDFSYNFEKPDQNLIGNKLSLLKV